MGAAAGAASGTLEMLQKALLQPLQEIMKSAWREDVLSLAEILSFKDWC